MPEIQSLRKEHVCTKCNQIRNRRIYKSDIQGLRYMVGLPKACKDKDACESELMGDTDFVKQITS